MVEPGSFFLDTAWPAGHAASSYKIHRSISEPDGAWTDYADVPDSAAPSEQYFDLGALSSTFPHSATHYYFVEAWNVHGGSGAP